MQNNSIKVLPVPQSDAVVVSPIAAMVMVADATYPEHPPRSSADLGMEGHPAPSTVVSELSQLHPVPHDLSKVEVLHNELVTAQAKIGKMEEELKKLCGERALSKREGLDDILAAVDPVKGDAMTAAEAVELVRGCALS